MRIGISAYGTRGLRSGLGHYLRNLLRVLLRDHREHEFVVYCQENERDAFDFPNLGLSPEFHCGSERHAGALYDILWHNFVLPRLARRHRIDVLFIGVDRRIPFFGRVPRVATVHDLAAFTVTGKYPITRQIYSKRVLPLLIRRLKRIVTISQSTRADLVEHLSLRASDITVAYNGVDLERFQDVDRERIPEVLERHGITKPYMLYTARLEHPGKNHAALVRAVSRIEHGTAAECQLVFVGNPWHRADRIEDAVKSAGMEDRVVFTGFVTDEDLPLLYHGAELFVFPSLYEGFGIPLLEAMGAGVPMAVARAASIPEVAGAAADYFDPHDEQEMQHVIANLAEDEERRRVIIAKGLERVGRFTWERCAATTLETILSALPAGKNGTSRS